jgi:hypothetical protein
MSSEAEGYVLEEPVHPPLLPVRQGPLVRPPHWAGETAPQRGNPTSPLFLLKLLRTEWWIGEHL